MPFFCNFTLFKTKSKIARVMRQKRQKRATKRDGVTTRSSMCKTMVDFKLQDFLYRKDAHLGIKVTYNFCSIKMRQMYDVSLLLFLISNLWTRVFNLLFQLTKLHDAIVLDLSASLIRVKKKRQPLGS